MNFIYNNFKDCESLLTETLGYLISNKNFSLVFVVFT